MTPVRKFKMVVEATINEHTIYLLESGGTWNNGVQSYGFGFGGNRLVAYMPDGYSAEMPVTPFIEASLAAVRRQQEGKPEPPSVEIAPAEPVIANDRGFRNWGNFFDSHGANVRIVESSAATDDFVWVFVDGGALHGNDGSAHLNVEGAKQLVAGLLGWIASVEQPASGLEPYQHVREDDLHGACAVCGERPGDNAACIDPGDTGR
jgi:hypothetical protein